MSAKAGSVKAEGAVDAELFLQTPLPTHRCASSSIPWLLQKRSFFTLNSSIMGVSSSFSLSPSTSQVWRLSWVQRQLSWNNGQLGTLDLSNLPALWLLILSPAIVIIMLFFSSALSLVGSILQHRNKMAAEKQVAVTSGVGRGVRSYFDTCKEKELSDGEFLPY